MGFAGSSRLDERRRRRLATGPGEADTRSSRRIDQAHLAGPGYGLAAGESPLGVLAPMSSWPMVLMTVASGVLATLLVYAAFRFDQHDVWGPVIGVTSGRALSFVSALMAFAIAQLCLIVYWYRRQSRKDFAGRYRRWLTAAFFALGASIALGAGIHETLATVLSRMLPPADWNTRTACWTVPVGVITAFLGPSIFRELRAFGVSSVLFCAGLTAAASIIALALIGNVALPAHQRSICGQVATLFACWSFLNAFWWHVRHVVRVSNEPPPSGQLRAELKRLMPQVRTKSKKAEVDPQEETSTGKRRRRKAQDPEQAAEPEQDADKVSKTASSTFVARSLGRVSAVCCSPFQSVSSRWAQWRVKRSEQAEQKMKEKELRNEAKRANNEAKRAKADAAKAQKQAAVEAKAESKRQAAEDKQNAKQAARDAKEAVAKKKDVASDRQSKEAAPSKKSAAPAETSAQGDSQKATAAERRAARKAKRAERNRVKSESLMPAELLEAVESGDEEHSNRSEKRRRKKSRR